MVTASQGTMTVLLSNGQTRSVNFYIADVIGTYVKLSTTGLATATSPDNYVMPIQGTIKDISIKTGPTVIGALVLEVNGNTAGTVYDLVTFVSTAPLRPPQNIIINQGSVIRLKEA